MKTNKIVKLAISGGGGRMGSSVWDLALQNPDFEVVVVLEKTGHPLVGQMKNNLVVSNNPDEIKKTDVLIEFTTPESTIHHLSYAKKYKKAMVIGTTELSNDHVRQIKEAANSIPILFSSNMSIGVNFLFDLVPKIAKKLGPEWDIEIIEVHHKGKKDAPSGTAKKFSQLISEVVGREIPTHSLRIGDVAGDHIIVFASQGERIEIIHRAQSPVLFARGALTMTKKLVTLPPGLYEPKDLL